MARVFAIQEQTSLSIAELLVEKVISHHGVLAELLSDSGQAFLLKLMIDVYKLLRDTKGKHISILRGFIGHLQICWQRKYNDWDGRKGQE